MSINDRELLSQSVKGTVYPGVANSTKANDLTHLDPYENNFMKDPTTPTFGAGAHPTRFEGHTQARRTFQQGAGVCEARPGIIESTNIHPLNENSNKDDGWANATTRTSIPPANAGKGLTAKASDVAWGAASAAAGAAKLAYGTALGNEATKQQGREQVWGKQ